MDSEIVGMSDTTGDAISFTWTVDNAIRSRTPSISGLGASPAHSFGSVVDNATRSLGASPAHSFGSLVDISTISVRSSQVEGFQLFTLAELVAATNNFSLDNMIGAGSFSVVYRGKLADGREVAIRKGVTGSKMKKFQENESAFEYELAFLSHLNHKHLVRAVGYCEEKDERLLVYEYMKNGASYDHLHDKNNVDKGSSVLNNLKSWIILKMFSSIAEVMSDELLIEYIIRE